MSANRNGSSPINGDSSSLASMRFVNGQMLYLQGAVKAAKSVANMKKVPTKILRGGKVVAVTEEKTKRVLTRE